MLDKQQLDVLSPQSAGQAGGFRYIYKDDQNRRRSFDTACLLTIRSSSPQPQPHTPTSPNHSAPTALSPQLSPWLMTYATGGVHAAVRSEEGKAEQASKEEVDAVLRRLVADRRQAMAFVRWLDDDNDARSMRLLMGLVKLVERGEEMKGEDARQDDEDEKGEWRREERVKEFNNAVAAVVSTHLRGKGEKHNHSSLPSLPFPLFRFLLSFTSYSADLLLVFSPLSVSCGVACAVTILVGSTAAFTSTLVALRIASVRCHRFLSRLADQSVTQLSCQLASSTISHPPLADSVRVRVGAVAVRAALSVVPCRVALITQCAHSSKCERLHAALVSQQRHTARPVHSIHERRATTQTSDGVGSHAHSHTTDGGWHQQRQQAGG